MTASIDVRRSEDGAVVRLTFSEQPGNVLSLALVRALRDAVAGATRSGRVKILLLRGEGEHFSFGASIPEHLPPDIARVLPETHALLRDLLACPAVTAAIVRGRCLGGGFELALACDLIFAAEDATLGLPEIALGVFPPAGSALLPLRVGGARATAAILSGAPRTGREWHEAGLVTVVAPAPALDVEVDRWCEQFVLPRSAAALRHAAAAARLHVRALGEPAIAQAERLYLDRLMTTRDAIEGVTAFIEKRPPKWQDG
jgi:cyclohexa-1,5-dienecarbonyl-CoA hydratase